MAKVDVISSCLVKMANCNATSISRMELTPWDLQFLSFGPNQKGILFHKPQSTQKYIHHLKHSLSLTLDFFPPLSGRLSSSDKCFFVDCNDAGALFVHAVAGGVSVADILEPTNTPEIVASFFPTSCEGACLAVQVTELEDGVFIGCTGYYFMDGSSLWHFFNSWSEMSRGFDKISKTPAFDRYDNRVFALPSMEINQWQKYTPPPLLERVFYISKENLAKLKSKANLESGNVKKISSLQALSAHLWRSYTRFQRRDDDDGGVCPITMAIGARGRIPLPEGYFGKAVYTATTAVTAAELLQRGLGFAAVKINEMVSMQTKEAAIKFVQDWVANTTVKGKGSMGLLVSGSPLFNVYGNDFGWGKPIAARSSKMEKFEGRITLFPAAVAGGVDVEVSFAPEVLKAMGDDAEFMVPFAAA